MNRFDLKKKVAIITGGAQGFGFDIAKRFLKSGARVIIWDNNENELKKIVKKIKNKNLYKQMVDVTDPENVEDAVKKITKNMKIDILVNSAGITGSTTELWNYDYEEWKTIVDINLHGTFNCCKAVVPHMIKKNYGRIVNIASVSGKDGNVKASAYSSSKAGVIALTKSLGKELANKNIAVNAVTPAGAKTRILNQMSREHVKRMLSKVPRARFLKLNELSSMVCWLSSDENSFSTAAVFDISGGRSTY